LQKGKIERKIGKVLYEKTNKKIDKKEKEREIKRLKVR